MEWGSLHLSHNKREEKNTTEVRTSWRHKQSPPWKKKLPFDDVTAFVVTCRVRHDRNQRVKKKARKLCAIQQKKRDTRVER
jgi:hypothetical protein